MSRVESRQQRCLGREIRCDVGTHLDLEHQVVETAISVGNVACLIPVQQDLDGSVEIVAADGNHLHLRIDRRRAASRPNQEAHSPFPEY